MSKNNVFDVLIVGGGVVGACVLNKLTRIGKKCLLIDKASDVATGASKANSGLVHAGYDPKPNTLKAKLNIRGNKLYPKLCKRLGVKLDKCGALVLGDDETQLDNLYQRGLENKVYVEKWNRNQILEKVPDLADHITCALYARDAYIVSPYFFTISVADEAVLNGAKVSLEEDLVSVEKKDDIFEVVTKKATYYAKQIVNSAGAGYNEVAKLLKAEEYPLEFRRGEYFVFDKIKDFNVPCTLFTMPTKLGKGVLITPTIDGNFLLGPTSTESDTQTKVTSEGLDEIRNKAQLIVKNINFRNSIRQFSGVRVISGDDFVVEKSKVTDGVINIAGICSPGLTSAPAIAEMVTKLLGFSLKEKENLKPLKKRVLFKELSKAKQIQLCKENKNYCSIVCKCEEITKGDVIEALNRPIKVASVDAVKRRCNAGMGRCQGGFCFTKVVAQIIKERKIAYEQVKKENRGSEVCLADIREVNND